MLYGVQSTRYNVDSGCCRPGRARLEGEPVQITATAVSLNVEDVAASSAFLTDHFGFRQEMAADGFASLAREDTGMYVVFLRRGLETLPDDQRDTHVGGLILAFMVDDLEGELARLRAEGVAITMPLTVEEWGERAFQVTDPNGVIIQLMDRAARPGHQPPRATAPSTS
jgi:catechol 2,3-dioxygenase-like lactoylglutathione lyase family enzyme